VESNTVLKTIQSKVENVNYTGKCQWYPYAVFCHYVPQILCETFFILGMRSKINMRKHVDVFVYSRRNW